MKAKLSTILTTLAVAGLFSVASAQTTITVSGTVKDSATGQPIAQATILLTATDVTTLMLSQGSLTNLKFDTVYTGADGSFSRAIHATATQNILGWMVTKTGYQMKYSIYPFTATTTTISLGTILLAGVNNSVKDTVTVSGTVVDSITGSPVANALVGMTGLLSLDTTGNTVFTGANGTFSKKVIINNAATARILIYAVAKNGYTPGGGQAAITSKTINLGTIRLKPIVTVVVARPLATPSRANNLQIFSLRGQLLYAGPVVSAEKVLQTRHTPVIMNFRHNDRTINSVKIVPSK